MRIRLLFTLALAFCLGAAPASRELIVCGWDEVFILDMTKKPAQKIWSWRAADHPELPVEYRDKFKTTDDCKPVNGGKQILISSSSDGVALVERATGKVLFYGAAGGAHSIEMLPGGRIAVAASTSPRALNNRLVIFDVKQSGRALFDTELTSGHGVVWDNKRQALWALGLKVLRTYKLQNWDSPDPSLTKTAEYELPDNSGHDLMAVPGTSLLSITTHHSAWMFDRDKHTFTPHPQLAGKENVKSITVHPQTKEIVWTQADKGFWWTAALRFLNPESTHEIKGERLYKARWLASE